MRTVAPLLPRDASPDALLDPRFDPVRVNAVRVFRVAKGWTQSDLADHVNGDGAGKVTKAHVSFWETGRMSPGPSVLPRVARTLGVDPVRLVYWLSVFEPRA